MDLVVTNHVTLDGVMQAPAGADEDPRGGFEHGGWAAANADEVMGSAMGERMSRGGALLFGRRTYEKMAAFWPHQPADNPYAKAINEPEKYVASRTLEEPLAWDNATLLEGDAADAVAALKEQPGGSLSSWAAATSCSRSCAATSSTGGCSSSTRSCSGPAGGCSPTAGRRPACA